MARRTTRSDMPADPAAAVRALGACRKAMIEVHRTVKPTGPAYHGAGMVIAAIDGFATFLTGQRYYFWADGTVGGGKPVDGEDLRHDASAGPGAPEPSGNEA